MSDGESDLDETDGEKRANQNADSVGEIPFVKMVKALSSLDNNANATTNSSKKPAAVIHPTDLTRDPLSQIKAKHSEGFIQAAAEAGGLLGNGTLVPEGVMVKQKRSLTSELSQRLRRASGESNKSSASSHGAEEYVMIDEVRPGRQVFDRCSYKLKICSFHPVLTCENTFWLSKDPKYNSKPSNPFQA